MTDWEEVAKVISTTTYRTPLRPSDKAIYMVDVRKVVELLKTKFEIKKINRE